MSEFIAEEQAGFLPNRQIKDNLRTVINAIEYYDKHCDREVVFFFVDAEKAFDNLNWDFMFATMEKLQMGEKFIQAVKEIYRDQSAAIIVNEDLTKKNENQQRN